MSENLLSGSVDSESLCSHLRDSDLSLPAPIRLTEQTFTRHLSNKPKYQVRLQTQLQLQLHISSLYYIG